MKNMKDACILTKFYKNYNYGGMLQGYALKRAVRDLGYSVDLISYDVNANPNPVYPGLRQQIEQYGPVSAVEKAGEKAIARGSFLISDLLERRKKLFDAFMEKTQTVTKIYDDTNAGELCSRYSAFISGSDQVWNPNAVRNLYLQTFADDPARKISYAASIGRDSFSEREAAVLVPAIREFGSISVRERTAKKLLEGYIDAPIETSLDPTMLLSSEDWSEVSSEPLVKGDYVLVYFFSDSLNVRRKTEQFFRKRGMKMVLLPYAKQEYNLTDASGPGERVEDVGPGEFVSLVKNASFVLTDSFHGAVFSLIFKKPFAVFERNKTGHVSMNSRRYDLLDLFDQSHRLVSAKNSDEMDYLFEVDAGKIDSIWARERERSLKYLSGAVQGAVLAAGHSEQSCTVSPDEERCTGCGACAAVCPTRCISLESNRNGFVVPQIDTNKCIMCGRCRNACPIQGKKPEMFEPVRCLGAYTIFEDKESASGGIGGVLCRLFAETGGAVYGTAYTERMEVCVKRADSPGETDAFKGSKYVQSYMGDAADKVVMDLAAGRRVLFTGTPCQVAGVRAAVATRCHTKEQNLYTAEIICHGVPSPAMFKSYLNWLWEKHGQKVEHYRFRAKERDTDPDYLVKIGLENGSDVIQTGFRDPYYRLFLSSRWFRKVCYECPFASHKRAADLTMGDFWNAEVLPDDFGTDRRVSVLLVNNKRGEELLRLIFGELEALDITWETAAEGNANLRRPTPRPGVYTEFGDVRDTGAFFDHEATGKVNRGKYWFNRLPSGMRRTIKKEIKVLKHKN